ncbi:WXG100 family type VII secretion target [Rhodococcoides kroppenstedtii]|nr:WXG100 family type VII secretion target [Rhodococcus kroppenstedtii]MBT1193294.1 WXG100 family type VII secretion target [Rhodococcus kroppenstedtii]
MRTTVETMQVTAGKVDQLTLEVKALLDQLRGDVASVGGSWEGAAAVAFQSVMNSWDTSANKLQLYCHWCPKVERHSDDYVQVSSSLCSNQS